MDNDPRQDEQTRKDALQQARTDRRKENTLPLVLVGEGTEEHFQHDDLWFEDGNVIIVAENVWYKLHRGILAKHSGVFRDMFQVADSSAGDSVQGCPTVSVTDDAQHMTLFLLLLYDAAKQCVIFFCGVTDPLH